MEEIIKLQKEIENQLFSGLDYKATLLNIKKLAELVDSLPDDYNNWYDIGETGLATVADMLIGTYWHLTEWHSGQWSDSYETLCVIGNVYKPGYCSGVEPDTSEHEIYQILNCLAESN